MDVDVPVPVPLEVRVVVDDVEAFGVKYCDGVEYVIRSRSADGGEWRKEPRILRYAQQESKDVPKKVPLGPGIFSIVSLCSLLLRYDWKYTSPGSVCSHTPCVVYGKPQPVTDFKITGSCESRVTEYWPWFALVSPQT